jgi:asparaginyl-tRNA synthetase
MSLPSLPLKDLVGQEITLQGWLYNKRSSGSIAFLEIREGTTWISAVVSKAEVAPEVWDAVEKITQESSLKISGIVTKHPKKENTFELQVKNLSIIHLAEEFPIAKKDHGPDFLMEHRHLWLRSPRQWAIMRVRDAVIQAINEYLHKEKFIKIDSPVFTPNACEGTTTLFPVPYFDLGTAYLS